MHDGAAERSLQYYEKPYADEPDKLESRTIRGQRMKVYRPDHGFAHSMRKSVLITDLIEMIFAQDGMTALKSWLLTAIRSNHHFCAQLQFAALMMRTGRQAEHQHKDSYGKKSANDILKEAQDLLSSTIAGFVVILKSWLQLSRLLIVPMNGVCTSQWLLMCGMHVGYS